MTTVRLGVFLIEGSWRLFRDEDRLCDYPDRDEAICAAKREARRARSEGARVELHFQDRQGELHLAGVLAPQGVQGKALSYPAAGEPSWLLASHSVLDRSYEILAATRSMVSTAD